MRPALGHGEEVADASRPAGQIIIAVGERVAEVFPVHPWAGEETRMPDPFGIPVRHVLARRSQRVLVSDRRAVASQFIAVCHAAPLPNTHLEIARLMNERLCFFTGCLLYTSPSPRDKRQSRMPSSA